MTEERYPLLQRYLSGGYGMQSADRDPLRPEGGPIRTVHSGRSQLDLLSLPSAVLEGIVHEIHSLLGEQRAEADLSDILQNRLGCQYNPQHDGIPVKDWLRGLLLYAEDRIRTEASELGARESNEVRALRLRPAVAREVERIGCDELALRTGLPLEVITGFVDGGIPTTPELDRFRYYDFSAFSDLSFLSGVYFHEEFSTASPVSWESTVKRYIAVESSGRIRGTIGDINRFLLDITDEVDLQRALEEMGCSFFPPSFGLTYRGWLERVRDTLASSTPGDA
jgi:hypothetical protein